MMVKIQLMLVATVALAVPLCVSTSIESLNQKGGVDSIDVNDNVIDNSAKSKAIQNNNHQHEHVNSNSYITKNNNNNNEERDNNGDVDGVLIQSQDENSDYGDDDDDDNSDNNESSSLSSADQIKLLSKQLSALTQQRREDYQLLENNLKKYVKKNLLSIVDEDVRKELEQLR